MIYNTETPMTGRPAGLYKNVYEMLAMSYDLLLLVSLTTFI